MIIKNNSQFKTQQNSTLIIQYPYHKTNDFSHPKTNNLQSTEPWEIAYNACRQRRWKGLWWKVNVIFNHLAKAKYSIINSSKTSDVIKYLERLYYVVLITLQEVRPHFADLVDPLPANGEPAPRHRRSSIAHQRFIKHQVVFHNVNTVVPVEWIIQHYRISLLDRNISRWIQSHN